MHLPYSTGLQQDVLLQDCGHLDGHQAQEGEQGVGKSIGGRGETLQQHQGGCGAVYLFSSTWL